MCLAYRPEAFCSRVTDATGGVHPSIGAFETEVWTVPITIGGRAVTLEAGVLPPALERTLGAVSGGWIVGSDFFRDRAIVLAYPEGAVYDAPGSATPAG